MSIENPQVLKDKLGIGNMDWLSPAYSPEVDFADYKNDPNDVILKLYRIEEITFEEESPRQEALENVIACLRIPGINLIYLLLGDGNSGVRFYFGVSRDLQMPQKGINLDEITEQILAPALRGNFRGSKVERVDDEELFRISSWPHKKVGAKQKDSNFFYAMMNGVPGSNKDKEKKDFQGVDRLVDIMLNDQFGLMVVAKPLCDMKEIHDIEKTLEEVYTRLMFMAKQQYQTSTNSSTNSSENSSRSRNYSHNEGTSTSKGVSKTEGTNTSKQKSVSVNDTTGTSETSGGSSNNTGSNKSHQSGRSRADTEGDSSSIATTDTDGTSSQDTFGESTSNGTQTGRQDGVTTGFSRELVSKRVQEWLKYCDDIIYPRLDCGTGKGLFVCSTLLFSNIRPVLTKLSNVIRSIYTGEVGNRAPLLEIPLEENSPALAALKQFQQPLLTLDDDSDSPAVALRSRCRHYGKGKPTENYYYAGHWMSTVELSRLASIPQKEVVGLRLREEVEFGLNVCGDNEKTNNIVLGELVQSGNKTNIPVKLDLDEFDRHLFIAGVTGSGKTTTCQRILCETKRPFLVIEPAKTEYRIMLENMPDMLIFTLGTDGVAPFRLNPLEFTRGETISSRVDMLMASINASFEMEAAIPQLIEQAIYEAYKQRGWNIKTNSNKFYPGEEAFTDGVYAFPTLSEVVKCVETVVATKGFGERLRDEYLGSIRARLDSLLVGEKGLMLDCQRGIDFEELLDKNVVLELEEIRNGAEKALLIGFILTNLLVAIKHKYRKSGNKKIEHITLVEEAHRLMAKYQPGDNPNKKHAVETFSDMLAEIRKYGEAMIIADQIPNKLTPDVLKNTNIKIVHRLFAQDDKDVIGSTMSLTDEQRNYLSSLEVGRAVVFSGNWSKAVHTSVTRKTDTSSQKQVSDEALRRHILKFYSEEYKRGIFPGLEMMTDAPTFEELEWYIKHIQNEDFTNFFKHNRPRTVTNDWMHGLEGLNKLSNILQFCPPPVLAVAVAIRNIYELKDGLTKAFEPDNLKHAIDSASEFFKTLSTQREKP